MDGQCGVACTAAPTAWTVAFAVITGEETRPANVFFVAMLPIDDEPVVRFLGIDPPTERLRNRRTSRLYCEFCPSGSIREQGNVPALRFYGAIKCCSVVPIRFEAYCIVIPLRGRGFCQSCLPNLNRQIKACGYILMILGRRYVGLESLRSV